MESRKNRKNLGTEIPPDGGCGGARELLRANGECPEEWTRDSTTAHGCGGLQAGASRICEGHHGKVEQVEIKRKSTPICVDWGDFTDRFA
jgi:hypothetical protein